VREPYQAFATKDKFGRIDIRTNDGLCHSPAYAYLPDVSHGRRAHTSVLLVFSIMLVRVQGRSLRSLTDAIKLHTCEYIAQFDPPEFDPREFDPPADSDAPHIERIKIQTARTTARQRESETES
jgi:hypothetical protein